MEDKIIEKQKISISFNIDFNIYSIVIIGGYLLYTFYKNK